MIHPTSCFYACSTFLHSFKTPHSQASPVAQNQNELVQDLLSSQPDLIDRSMTRRRMRSLFSICPMTTRLIGSPLVCTALHFSVISPRGTERVRLSVPPPRTRPCLAW